MAQPVAIRRHAILKRHYRRAVASTSNFHDLDQSRQWALLRDQVEADSTERETLVGWRPTRND